MESGSDKKVGSGALVESGTQKDSEGHTSLELSHVGFSYGKKDVLRDVSFRLKQGDIAVLVGANGAGKSTLIKVIAGLLRAKSGEIKAVTPKRNPKNKERTTIGYVPQDDALFEDLKVIDNIALWSHRSMKSVHEHVRNGFLSTLGLDGILQERVATLSGGMKKRVSLAGALIDAPQVIVLDEPFTSLDLVYQQELQEILERYAAQGGTVLLSTHEQAGYDMSQRCFVMKDGSVEEMIPKPAFDKLAIRIQ